MDIVSLVTGALIGSLISNIKGIIEIYQALFPKPDAIRIAIQGKLVSHRDLNGNFVMLTNLSERVALLSYWEIVRQSPFPIFRQEMRIADSDDGPTQHIEPNTEYMLSFTDEEWFQPWSPNHKGWRVVFRYRITGERLQSVVLTRG